MRRRLRRRWAETLCLPPVDVPSISSFARSRPSWSATVSQSAHGAFHTGDPRRADPQRSREVQRRLQTSQSAHSARRDARACGAALPPSLLRLAADRGSCALQKCTQSSSLTRAVPGERVVAFEARQQRRVSVPASLLELSFAAAEAREKNSTALRDAERDFPWNFRLGCVVGNAFIAARQLPARLRRKAPARRVGRSRECPRSRPRPRPRPTKRAGLLHNRGDAWVAIIPFSHRSTGSRVSMADQNDTLLSVLAGHPDSPALHVEALDRTFSRGEVLALASKFANVLRAAGVKAGDIVTVVEPNQVRKLARRRGATRTESRFPSFGRPTESRRRRDCRLGGGDDEPRGVAPGDETHPRALASAPFDATRLATRGSFATSSRAASEAASKPGRRPCSRSVPA